MTVAAPADKHPRLRLVALAVACLLASLAVYTLDSLWLLVGLVMLGLA